MLVVRRTIQFSGADAGGAVPSSGLSGFLPTMSSSLEGSHASVIRTLKRPAGRMSPAEI